MDQPTHTTTEIERTFLAKTIPIDLPNCKFIPVQDTYLPFSSPHPKVHIRKLGDQYELTKKVAINEYDHSMQHEHTIELTQEEYDELATVNGKRISKRRYYLPVSGKIAEVDVFLQGLLGLIIVDFEFPSEVERDSFTAPAFCGPEVTQAEFVAGGFLAGKTYEEIAPYLEKYDYKKLSVPGVA